MAKSKTRKPRARRNQNGHPAKAAAQRKRYTNPPHPDEAEVRELVRLVRREATASSEERTLVGPIAAAAKRAAEILCDRDADLDTGLHRHGVANYLTERLGAVLDEFSAEDYMHWRDECLSEIRSST